MAIVASIVFETGAELRCPAGRKDLLIARYKVHILFFNGSMHGA